MLVFFDIIEMGNQNTWCGQMNTVRLNELNQIETDEEDYSKINTDNHSGNPLTSFINRAGRFSVKTLNKIKEENEKKQHEEIGSDDKKEEQSIQEEIAKRIRRKTVKLNENATHEILRLMEEQIQRVAIEKSENGEYINKEDIDRGQVFKKLKINLASFIKTKGENVSKYYTFHQCIGEGSYGRVFRAVCKRTKEQRAIKVLKHRVMRKEDACFLAEINLLTQLDHPNIVKLYEIYYYKSFYYVVMEYCKGGSIVELIKKVKKFSEAMVAHIMKQLLSALGYMHKKNIIHRDIKLDNIVFLDKQDLGDPQGSSFNYSIKIIDFGTATKLGEQKKKLAGTRYYMAPQIFQGLLNSKSDLWSCGVFLYLFFTGKFPFKGKTLADVQHQVNTKIITFSESQWKNISLQAKRLILALLQKNIDKRLSAQQALSHQWFKRSSLTVPVCSQQWNLDQLQKYQRGNNLIAIIESYLTLKNITQQQRQKMALIFREIDTNNDGTIQISQLTRVYQQQYGVHTQVQVNNILQKIDHNQSGKIDFNQFILGMYTRKRLFLEQSLTAAFKHYDIDHNGYLQKVELKKLLEGCEMEEIDFVLTELDTDCDDKVSLNQFLAYMHKFR